VTFAVESNGLIFKLNKMKDNIWEQAVNDALSTRLNTSESVSYIRKGIKMENKNGEIKIYNTKFSNDFYTELTDDEYELFLLRGWRIGCYTMAIKNYRRSLERISKKIITEINQRNNTRHYQALKESRNDLMSRFTDTLKLIQNEYKQLNIK